LVMDSLGGCACTLRLGVGPRMDDVCNGCMPQHVVPLAIL
jgi:hypothetical protein